MVKLEFELFILGGILMKKLFTKIRDKCAKERKKYPMHMILALIAIFEGFNLVFDNDYFLYPPYLREEMNSNIIGTVAIITGLLIIHWCFNDKRTDKANKHLLAFLSAFFAFETIAEIIQIYAPQHNQHVITAGFVNFALLCIALSLEKVTSDK